MKRNSVLRATLALVGFSLMLASAPPAHALGSCTTATIAGVYGYVTSDFGNVGYVTFDGRGRYFVTNYKAVIPPDTGSYTVNPDCSGSAAHDNGTMHVNFVIVSGGQEILGVDTGSLLTFDFKRRDLIAPIPQ